MGDEEADETYLGLTDRDLVQIRGDAIGPLG